MYTLHSETEVSTFLEVLKMEWLLLLAFWYWLLKPEKSDSDNVPDNNVQTWQDD